MTDWSWPTWDEWVASVDSTTRARAESLRHKFAHLGANDPESWARSEISEDIAQTARYLFLRGVWRRMHEEVEDVMTGDEAIGRLRAAGIEEDELRRLLRRMTHRVLHHTLYMLDEPDGTSFPVQPHSDVDDDDPRWKLMELAPDGTMTDRDVGGLHESFNDVSPPGGNIEEWF